MCDERIADAETGLREARLAVVNAEASRQAAINLGKMAQKARTEANKARLRGINKDRLTSDEVVEITAKIIVANTLTNQANKLAAEAKKAQDDSGAQYDDAEMALNSAKEARSLHAVDQRELPPPPKRKRLGGTQEWHLTK